LGTTVSLTTVAACFHTSLKLLSPMCTCSSFSGGLIDMVVVEGGPGTSALALSREKLTQTAVISRNAIVTINRSMNGIMLISLFTERLALAPPPRSIPAMITSPRQSAHHCPYRQVDEREWPRSIACGDQFLLLSPIRLHSRNGAAAFQRPCSFRSPSRARPPTTSR
jgi:hypothetical protein